jgi:hypothetical protein
MNQQFVIPDNSPNWNSSITTQLRYKHAFYQNLVSTNKLLSLYSHKNMTCLNVGLLRICRVFFFLSPVKLCIGVWRQIAVSWAMLSVFNQLTRIQSSETQRLTERPGELHIYIWLTDRYLYKRPMKSPLRRNTNETSISQTTSGVTPPGETVKRTSTITLQTDIHMYGIHNKVLLQGDPYITYNLSNDNHVVPDKLPPTINIHIRLDMT